MKIYQTQTKILLVGDNLQRLEKMFQAFQEPEFELLFASDIKEGFRVTRRERPHLIISEIGLPDNSGLEFCEMVCVDKELSSIPFVFFCDAEQNKETINEAFRIGADDCFAECLSPQHLTAKVTWLIERKHSEEILRQYYQILRCRQSQITSIIKQTSELIENLDYTCKSETSAGTQNQEFEKSINKRIDLGFGMIAGLANLLDEQVRALDIWERSLNKELTVSPNIGNEQDELNHREISCN